MDPYKPQAAGKQLPSDAIIMQIKIHQLPGSQHRQKPNNALIAVDYLREVRIAGAQVVSHPTPCAVQDSMQNQKCLLWQC